MENASDSIPVSVTYARPTLPPSRRALFADGQEVRITTGRVRAYPGLPSEAPPTLPYYAFASSQVCGDGVTVDIGCGSGIGARMLTQTARQVVAVDSSEEALSFARRFAGKAIVQRADACAALPAMQFDTAVFIDVLGHMTSPFDALATVHERLPGLANIFIAEPAAHLEQCLRAPLRRGFSRRALESLLTATGFIATEWHAQGSFLVCTACSIEDDGVNCLIAAARTSNPNWAIALFEEAKKSENPRVKVEAALGRADLLIARGDGDQACRELFEARELAPNDPRPTSGLARISLLTNQTDDARTLAEIAVRLDPTEPGAHAILALAKEAVGEPSLFAWRAAVNLAPGELAYVDKLVDAAAAAGDPKLAVHAAERARLYEGGDSRDAQLVYAKALIADGREADARYEIDIANAVAKG